MTTPPTPTDPMRKPHAAIGFTAIYNGGQEEIAKSQAALQRALGHFADLTQRTFEIGQTRLTLWGRGDLEESASLLPDGSRLALIGSPSGSYSWQAVADKVLHASSAEPFALPWEGRVILLRIEPHSSKWTLWNDWVGSIPVYHAPTGSGHIASTLEPAVVEALSLGAQDIFLPGLLALLMWGHYFSDWTLFNNMKALPPDCEARWDQGRFSFSPCRTIQPSEQRWQAGWDEIMEEMHVLSKKAIISVLKEQPRWILPLSSGLDSRLIAGVAAELGSDISAYTWGTPRTSDVIHAESIARALGIPWKTINPGSSYLASEQQRWADLFGSGMHFHGMYQMPFLDALKTEPAAPIISGFIGDCMTGYDVKFLNEISQAPHPYQILPDGYMHWTVPELFDLMRVPIDDALAEVASEYERQLKSVPGPLYQQLRFIILWGRQRHFTYFQSWMSDYWRGVATPYINRAYARFALSLPRAILDERVMQQMMFVRYYPKLASIPGSYAREPAMLSGSYLMKKRFARYLPEETARAVFPGLYRSRSNSDVACVQRDGKASFRPLFDDLSRLTPWMDIEKIGAAYDKILTQNDSNAVRKLQSIQTIAYRLTDHA